ncbi:gluconeogenesis factor YvcK family protein [Acetivibrio mesophilus]|uniref:Putative gluconeogenesis factor n=1 Tax=Acetivibrio mesophilus TaxID=2487273 RepID=A0A4Q0I4E4_9FIRM|nr:YvcK family protein [Acetivibrio mesophilus]ODM26038.1 2-phospho-L-lactate transferase [Clostridium sp. Bc-iso-3]RXE59164.1 YvcK family protein [Acetivibrio mesophilus]
MKNNNWPRKNIAGYRWFLMTILGIIFISASMFLAYRYDSILDIVCSILFIISGCMFIIVSVRLIATDMLHKYLRNSSKEICVKDKDSCVYEKEILDKGPKIVAIGGGTGLSTMLRGLKAYSSNITAVVTVADDGGGSGVLRQDLGILPPGDIRNCIMALADTEPIMEKLLQYRFQDGMLKGQSFGNLFLAAMDGISPSFEQAVQRMSDVLAVKGRVLPVTLEDIKLCAELEDGYVVAGESKIGDHNSFHRCAIKRVYLEPRKVKPLDEVIEAIGEADVIVLGPGSLFTSIIPNLLVDGVCNAIKNSKALKVYVCNVMTQPGETEGYSVSDHIKALERHSFQGIVDYCIFNTADIPELLKKKYAEDGAQIVRVDPDELDKLGIKLEGGDFVCINNSYIRHDTMRLAQAIMNLVIENAFGKDNRKSAGYVNAIKQYKNMVG